MVSELGNTAALLGRLATSVGICTHVYYESCHTPKEAVRFCS